MDAPSLPRVARPAGRRVAAPVVAVATQRPAPATAPPAPAADQDGDDPSLDFTTPATRDESEALAEAEPVTNPEPEPQTVAEPIPATPAPTTPTAVVAPTPAAVATAAATPIATPASPSQGGGLRTLVVIRNGVVDYDDNTVQVLDMDSLHDAGAHDLADALLALKGADRSTPCRYSCTAKYLSTVDHVFCCHDGLPRVGVSACRECSNRRADATPEIAPPAAACEHVPRSARVPRVKAKIDRPPPTRARTSTSAPVSPPSPWVGGTH